MDLRDSFRKLFLSKRGIFFTLIAVSLLGIVLFSYSITYSYTLQEQSAVVETRIDAMNSFLKEVDADMVNAIYIVGFRSLVAMTDDIVSSGVFVDDVETAFEELFMNGSLDGENASLMENNTFPYWISKIGEEANNIGMDLSLNVTSVSIAQSSPWAVRITVNSTINISDMKETAMWSQDKNLYSEISIIGFEDPAYTVYTANGVVKRINQTIYDNNFTSVSTNTTNMRDHVNQTFYANFTGAPSFLMRFEDNFNSSIYGIESFVDKSEVSPYHACPTETSSVDTIYWRCNTSISVYKASNWTGFRIDNQTDISGNLTRLERYMMEDYIIGS